MPKISIIVPVYNAENYLQRCVDSILAQTYSDFELLLIDDGSSDSSGKICDEYASKDARIRVFHKENGGVSSARNLGLDHAKGEIVVFVDSDDWASPIYCSTIISNIGNADILFFSETWHFEDGCVLIYSAGETEVVGKDNVEEELYHLSLDNSVRHGFLGYTWDKAFLRHIIEENHIRFVNSLYHQEDEAFSLEYCLYVDRLKYIDAGIYHYQYTKSGLSYNNKPASQWLLYYNTLSPLVSRLANKQLVHSLNKRLSTTLVNAFFASSNFRLKKETFLILKKHCKNTQDGNPHRKVLKRCTRKISSFLKKNGF